MHNCVDLIKCEQMLRAQFRKYSIILFEDKKKTFVPVWINLIERAILNSTIAQINLSASTKLEIFLAFTYEAIAHKISHLLQ